MGTTVTKAVLFDLPGSSPSGQSRSGAELSVAEQATRLHTPRPGWAELDPDDIWQAVVRVLQDLAGGVAPGTDIRAVALAARVGIELGADWVKVPYVEGFRQVTGACFKPVVILGGSRRSSKAEILAEVKQAMDEEAAGATTGRNIFEADDPEAMTAALAAIIHQDASVEQALAILKRA